MAKSQSKTAGVKNTPATIAIVIGFVVLVLTIIAIVAGIALTAAVLSSACEGLDPGVYETTNGGTITCS